MKNRILAALLALVLGVPLYLLAADAAPTAAAKTVSSAAPAQAVALLKALPSVEDLAAAMTPEADAAAMIARPGPTSSGRSSARPAPRAST